MKWLKPAVLLIFVVSLAACNSTDNHEDIFNVYAVATGKVISKPTEKPVQGANVFFDVTGMGPDCQQQHLAKPEKYDSTKTGPNGTFSARLTFINMDGPVCIQAYVTSPEAASNASDTAQFSTGLKRGAPFDTTRITLSIGP